MAWVGEDLKDHLVPTSVPLWVHSWPSVCALSAEPSFIYMGFAFWVHPSTVSFHSNGTSITLNPFAASLIILQAAGSVLSLCFFLSTQSMFPWMSLSVFLYSTVRLRITYQPSPSTGQDLLLHLG